VGTYVSCVVSLLGHLRGTLDVRHWGALGVDERFWRDFAALAGYGIRERELRCQKSVRRRPLSPPHPVFQPLRRRQPETESMVTT
jgi:hypothetical protein